MSFHCDISPRRKLINGLRRLLEKLKYSERDDKIVHVGDLVVKGEKNVEVLEWMRSHEVLGVRGNHDQPVSGLSIRIHDSVLKMRFCAGDRVAGLDGMGGRTRLGRLHR